MEFKEVIKIRRRICDYYKDCDECLLGKLSPNCVYGLLKVENIDGYKRILEEWVKEHTVMTNADKYIEVMKNTFGVYVNKTKIRSACIKYMLNIECNDECISKECLKWWNEEYKEPEKEKKDEKI